MRYWLMKSEPSELSIDDLKKKGRWHWDGVRNYQARNYMRVAMQIGDKIIFYHSSAIEIGCAGIAQVASLPYPDHTQFDPLSKYFDPKSTQDDPRWIMVDVEFVGKFTRIITREEMKGNSKLQNMILWKRNRLSITPLTKREFDTIVLSASKNAA